MLEVARREGIAIPALCHEPGTPAWGGCRLCLVEVEGVDKLQAACTTWVADGMSVKTDTPRVRARRASYLKMYLSDHNSYCEAPCTHACPTHVDIPGFLALLTQGDLDGAATLVREELPFPGLLGRICPAYCEPVCRRGELDEPIAICALHRAVGDRSVPLLTPTEPSGRRVAVLGAGPAGLSAAWFLTARGHQVTLYDAADKPGGRLRYAIPQFRLPEATLDRELEPLWQAGARFVGGSRIVDELDGQDLLATGFDAVVVSLGRKRPAAPVQADSPLGAVLSGALDGLGLLRLVREGRPPSLGDKVLVVGAGVTALDVARTARRLGVESVRVVRLDGKEWTSTDKETRAAREEGIAVVYTTHYMEEAETICDSVAIMDHGRIVALDTPEALIASLGAENRVVFTAEGAGELQALRALPGVTRVEQTGERVVVHGHGDRLVVDVVEALLGSKTRFRDLRTEQPTLEDVFLALTGQEMRD